MVRGEIPTNTNTPLRHYPAIWVANSNMNGKLTTHSEPVLESGGFVVEFP
jgi:hypothetical protein